MIKLTEEQFDALIEYIEATVENAKPNSDLYDSVRKHRAREVLEKVLLSNDSNEVQD